MKKLASLGLLVALCGFVGCDESMNDRQADVTRDQSQADATAIREGHEQAADNVRNAAGKDALGNAQTDSAERKADAIEQAGENKADAVENAGEQKADQLEKQDSDTNPNTPAPPLP